MPGAAAGAPNLACCPAIGPAGMEPSPAAAGKPGGRAAMAHTITGGCCWREAVKTQLGTEHGQVVRSQCSLDDRNIKRSLQLAKRVMQMRNLRLETVVKRWIGSPGHVQMHVGA